MQTRSFGRGKRRETQGMQTGTEDTYIATYKDTYIATYICVLVCGYICVLSLAPGNPRDADWDGAKLSQSAVQCEQEPMSVESRQRYLPTAVSASRQQSRHQPHSRDTASDPFNGKKNQLENSLASTHVGLASGPQSLLGKP